VHVRTFQRWAGRYGDEGEAGLADRRVGGRSPRRAAQEELERMLGLYRDKYADFTVKHFHEQLVKRHGYKLGYTVTKLTLHAAGLVKPVRSRSAHRKKRQRRPLPGMMLHQDGSRHVWIEGRPPMDLIVTLDDATSEIYSMILVEEEGTASTFCALSEVIAAHGLFCALYTDRGAHYFHTPKGGERASRSHKTQVGRALAQLGTEHIASYSPQARGRSERAFRTLQDRLPKEPGATATLDPVCARCLPIGAGRDGETAFRSNKETDQACRRANHHVMTQPASPSTPSGPAAIATNEGDRSRATKTRQVHPLPTATDRHHLTRCSSRPYVRLPPRPR